MKSTILFILLSLNRTFYTYASIGDALLNPNKNIDSLHKRNFKGGKVILFQPCIAGYKDEISAIPSQSLILGLGLGYGYFLCKNLLIEAKSVYSRGFNYPHNDMDVLELAVDSKYYFIDRKRVSFFTGGMYQLIAFSNKVNSPTFAFHNAIDDGITHVFYESSLILLTGIGIKVAKHLTLQLSAGYLHNLYNGGGRKYNPMNYYGTFGMYYHFKK